MKSLLCLLIFGTLTSSIMAKANDKIIVGEFVDDRKASKNSNKPIFWGDKIVNSSQLGKLILLYPNVSIKFSKGTEIKIIGQLVTKDQGTVLSAGAIQLIKGSLLGQVAKTEGVSNQLKIFGRKTVSSIRGTTFNIQNDSESEVQVLEGEVLVKNIKTQKEEIVEGFVNESSPLIPPEKMNELWQKQLVEVLKIHRENAQALKTTLDKNIIDVYSNLSRDIEKQKEQYKGFYNQFRKNK